MAARRSVLRVASEGLRCRGMLYRRRADGLMWRKIRDLWRIIELFSRWSDTVWHWC